jgi:RNA polymerase primary sigma factor
MTSKLGKAEAKCGAAVQKSAKQKGASAKKGHRNVLSSLVSQIQKGVAPKSDGKAKAAPKKKSAAQKSVKKESAAQKSAKKKGGHALLEGLLSHISDAVQPKQKSAKKKSAAQKSAKKKSAAQKSAKKKSAAQKSAKSGGHFRKLLDRVVRRMEPKCGSEVQGKKASAGKHHDHDDATPPPAPAVSNEA